MPLTQQVARDVVHSLILHDGIIQHHKESFDKFVVDSINHVIEENSLIVLECENMRHVIKIKNVKVERCKIKEDDGSNRELWPRECIFRKQTYASAIYGDIVHNEEYKKSTDKGVVWELVRQTVCHEVLLCEIPIMLRSIACYTRHEPEYRDQNSPYDFGGNFIINGAEKVLVPQEKLKINHVFIFECREQKYWLVAEVRSCNEQKLRSTSTLTVPLSKSNGMNKIDVRVPYISSTLPLFVVLRLLGFETKDEAIRCIVSAGKLSGNSELPESWMDRGLYHWLETVLHNERDPKHPDFSEMPYTKLVEWVGCRGTNKLTKDERYKYVHHIMENEMLPHIATQNTEEALDRKRRYFAFIIHRLATTARNIHHTGKMTCLDDRDHYGNKKIETSGLLMALCLRQNWRNLLLSLLNSLRKTIKSKRNINVADMIQSKRVTDNFKYALSTGKWGVKKGGSTQTGVAQVLKRMVMVAWLGHLRRLNTPINREGRNPKPRQLQFSNWGVVCPATTPEGLPCGLIKSLALGSRITVGFMSDSFIRILFKVLDLVPFPLSTYSMSQNTFVQTEGRVDKLIADTDTIVIDMEDPVIIFVNGISIGIVDGYKDSLAILYKLRRKRLIPRDTSIFLSLSKNELYVTCDDGGIRRPLYVVEDSQEETCAKVNELWDKYKGPHPDLYEDLMTEQIVEYVDKHEESNLLVWSNPEHELKGEGFTHMEIHPILLFSETTALIPFSNHNPAPRNTYQSSMGQASIGIPGVDTHYRSQTYRLNYYEKPLCRTFMEEILSVDMLPAGQNPVVAVIPFGNNQEDSILMNKDAIDLGYFRCTFSRAYTETVKNGIGVDSEAFGKPGEMCTGLKAANYDKLTKRGVPNPGTIMHDTDIIIGKKMIINNLQGDKNAVLERDQSVAIRRFDNNVAIDSIMFSDIGKNRLSVNVKARGTRIPEQGDKFSCYTSDHEVLTTKGWVPINEITMEHKVATLIDDKRLEYVNPTATQEYDYEGEMYSLESNHISAFVTPNHNMYTRSPKGKYKLLEAEKVSGKTRMYKKNADEFDPGTYMDTFDLIGTRKLDMDAWLTFFGIWLAEGCTLRDWGISIAAHKQRVKDALVVCGATLGFAYKKHKDNVDDSERNAWCVSDKELVKYIKPLSVGSVNKKMPEWVWNLTRDQARTLIDGMMLGDGHTMKNGTRRYDTSSTQLADDFQRLCLHAGFACNKFVKYKAGHESYCKPRDEVFKSTVDAYRLTILTTQVEPSVNKTTKSDGMESYKGKVYCCTVPPSHVIYVRRNGKPYWCGNSRHGQKGVIGLVVPKIDLPYNPVTGITPTICVNALAFPSRMTAAHTIECFKSKAAALSGEFSDATPFETMHFEDVEEILEEHGYHKSGKEKLINGKTGEEMEAMIFMGPTYYQRLKQMVKEKIHGRARGPRQVTSRQATEGRARDGGLRFGEMERDCLAGHMAANVLKDRYLEQSDDYITYVCATCGLIAEPPSVKRKRNGLRASNAYCRPCDSSENVFRVRMTYNYKLLVQEAAAMGVAMRFRLETPIENRDLESCASIGVKVDPEGEVMKPKRMKKNSTLDRDVTLLTGAYAELTQGPTGDLKPLSELFQQVPKPVTEMPPPPPPKPVGPVPSYEVGEGQAYNPMPI